MDSPKLMAAIDEVIYVQMKMEPEIVQIDEKGEALINEKEINRVLQEIKKVMATPG